MIVTLPFDACCFYKAAWEGCSSCYVTLLQQPRSNAPAALEQFYRASVRLLQSPRRKITDPLGIC